MTSKKNSISLAGGHANHKAFLILQGPPSRFSKALGDELHSRGYPVKRINFCAGDWLRWHDRRVVNFRGSESELEPFLASIIQSEDITDIIYYADRIPVHAIAAKVARKHRVRAVSYEFGYLRPDWIIVERGGQSTYSHFPDNIDTIRKLAKNVPEPDHNCKYPHSLLAEGTSDVLVNLITYFFWFLFPRYNMDKYYNPVFEYLHYPIRFLRAVKRKKEAEKTVVELASGNKQYFVVPLQMQNDYQLRANSPYGNIRTFIDQTLESFFAHAGKSAKLVFKKHPLDNGIENWGKYIRHKAELMNLADQVIFIDGGNLDTLLLHASGCVMINSTAGIKALQLGSPVKVMGIATYDMEGLTYQGSLDDFWTQATPPAKKDVSAFVRLLAAAVHVRGNFYTPSGVAAATKEFADRLINEEVNSYSAFIDPPPRIAKARALGMEVDYP